MNSGNKYGTLGSIHVVLYKYSFFIADHLPAKVRPMSATEVIKFMVHISVDLNSNVAAVTAPAGQEAPLSACVVTTPENYML